MPERFVIGRRVIRSVEYVKRKKRWTFRTIPLETGIVTGFSRDGKLVHVRTEERNTYAYDPADWEPVPCLDF